MRIGIPTEVKNHEYRVAATPEGVRELTHAGHAVIVQAGAGVGSAILYKVVDLIVGLRATPEAEREGLDLADHGERAYNF